jgi:hypothetical protein
MLWLLSLTALLAAGIGAAVPFLASSGLPDPAVANREELLRWLITRDLAKESAKTRLALVQRLEEEFRRGVDWEALRGKTTEAQRKQLWHNIPLLLGPWLCEKASIFSRLPAAKRMPFLDESIDAILAWQGVDRLRQDSDAPAGKSPGLLSVLLDQVEKCKRDVEPQQRDRISQFLTALQVRMLTKQLFNAACGGAASSVAAIPHRHGR